LDIKIEQLWMINGLVPSEKLAINDGIQMKFIAGDRLGCCADVRLTPQAERALFEHNSLRPGSNRAGEAQRPRPQHELAIRTDPDDIALNVDIRSRDDNAADGATDCGTIHRNHIE
jgi:hypothetical protein